MKPSKLFPALLFLSLFSGVSIAGNPSDSLLSKTLATGNASFALRLYHQLGVENKNVFFSPYSISSAMGMVYAGARGNTASEIGGALSFGLEQDQIPYAFRQLNQNLGESTFKSIEKLTIANGLCLTGRDLREEYKALLNEYFDAEIFPGDVDIINNWVSDKTEGKITKILDKLSRNSACVLLNAIYFKGTWETFFKKDKTKNQPFKLSGSKQVDVPLMYQMGNFKVFEKETFQVAEIPYEGGEFSMIVLLPRETEGLSDLEKQMTIENLNQWLRELETVKGRQIKLYIPKFKLETDYDLVSPFQLLGIKNAFDTFGNADFSGMSLPNDILFISEIKHKAFVEVNEEGTEAAAVTAVQDYYLMSPRYPEFRADHPFAFIIRDNKTGSILFFGRLADPSIQ